MSIINYLLEVVFGERECKQTTRNMDGGLVLWYIIMFVASVIVTVIVGFLQKSGLLYRLRHKVR